MTVDGSISLVMRSVREAVRVVVAAAEKLSHQCLQMKSSDDQQHLQMSRASELLSLFSPLSLSLSLRLQIADDARTRRSSDEAETYLSAAPMSMSRLRFFARPAHR